MSERLHSHAPGKPHEHGVELVIVHNMSVFIGLHSTCTVQSCNKPFSHLDAQSLNSLHAAEPESSCNVQGM